jgi:GNAT superfamily N-acetyltransferase
MQDMDIRCAQVDDFDQWRVLWRSYLEFYGEQEDVQISQTTWQRFIDGKEPMHAFVAVRDGHIAGFAHLIGHRSTWSQKDRLYLNDLFVAQSHRQNGLARQLLEHARRFAASNNYEWLYWTTRESNATARTLYDQVGNQTDFVQYRVFID